MYSAQDKLRDARASIVDLEEQLQGHIFAASQQGRGTGTSLFSEVEDKRIALEKQVFKLKV